MPKLAYDAMRELRREKKKIIHNDESPSSQQKDPNELLVQLQKQETLERRVKNNETNNKKLIQDLHGRRVSYGQPIQLMHVDSGYFL